MSLRGVSSSSSSSSSGGLFLGRGACAAGMRAFLGEQEDLVDGSAAGMLLSPRREENDPLRTNCDVAATDEAIPQKTISLQSRQSFPFPALG